MGSGCAKGVKILLAKTNDRVARPDPFSTVTEQRHGNEAYRGQSNEDRHGDISLDIELHQVCAACDDQVRVD